MIILQLLLSLHHITIRIPTPTLALRFQHTSVPHPQLHPPSSSQISSPTSHHGIHQQHQFPSLPMGPHHNHRPPQLRQPSNSIHEARLYILPPTIPSAIPLTTKTQHEAPPMHLPRRHLRPPHPHHIHQPPSLRSLHPHHHIRRRQTVSTSPS